MTGPNDSSETRPISVAELLARSGTIGAPPPGGRRRRRRGNTDAVTVAELTGEIPIVHTGEIPVSEDHDIDHDVDHDADHDETSGLAVTNGTAAPGTEPHSSEHVARDAASAEPGFDQHDESIGGDRPRGPVRAEQMIPDPPHPVAEGEEHTTSAVTVDEPPARETGDQPLAYEDDDDLPSYLRGEREHLFGGSDSTDVMSGAPSADVAAPITPMRKVTRGAWVVLQSIIAVAFGAGLFLGFDQLWKWNNIVALVLSVLVIIGLVVTVRVVRKTEDIGSTLIAVAVGALVTLGPLALLQSN